MSQPDSEKAGTGVSVVVCCHNSATRLPETLAALAAQVVPAGLAWEVIVVDNASTDDTAAAARRLWPAAAPAPLAVVAEPTPGLSHARVAGLRNSRYSLISLVDDDNWVDPHWVATVAEIMAAHPEVGACGGRIELARPETVPAWFKSCGNFYAFGEQAKEPGDLTWTKGTLWGAGLTVRRTAWEGVLEAGFESILLDRTGQALTSGGDSELCFVLRLAGWHLWYDRRLFLKHDMSTGRLTWPYARRLRRSLGAAALDLDPYFQIQRLPQGIAKKLSRLWWPFRALAALAAFLPSAPKLLLGTKAPAGDMGALQMEYRLGQLLRVLSLRSEYDARMKIVRNAPWRTIS